MADSHIFNIILYDTATGTSKTTDIIDVEDKIEPTDTLSTIRDHLAKDKKLDSGRARLAFCTKNGARVKDTTKFSVYKTLVKEESEEKSEEKSEGKSEEKPEEKSKEKSERKSKEKSEGNRYDLYLESPSKKEKTELSDSAKKLLNSDLDMDLLKKKPEVLAVALKELASAYKHENFRAVAGGEVVTAAAMSEGEWSIVLQNTHYLNGHRMVFSRNSNGTRSLQRLDRAPYTAFAIKPRTISRLETADKSIRIEQQFEIPRYIVTDDAYVNVFETNSVLSSSLASSSFSQTDIEASAGGGAFGVSVSVKGGFSKSESDALIDTSSKSTSSMNITYNFPRVVLHLDHRSLELTEECIEALKKVDSEKDLIDFHHDFGHFFATNVELGGKLFASERFSSSESAKASDKANAMKASASASFSYGSSFQADASYSQENQKRVATQTQESRMEKALSWEARGGDTILCNNPPIWCPTVKPCRNWRVINQTDVMGIADFIGTFPGHTDIPSKFKKITDKTRKTVRCKFNLKANDFGEPYNIKNEFFGLRKNKERKALQPVLNKWIDVVSDKDASSLADQKHFRSRAASEDYTVNYSEYIGINTYDEGCLFEVDVETVMDGEPYLNLNQQYLIYNRHFDRYLSAHTTQTKSGRFFGYLFFSRRWRAANFMFRKKDDRDKTGRIEENMEVELTYCEDERPFAVVERYKDDGTTLMLSKYKVTEDLSTVHNSRLQYVR